MQIVCGRGAEFIRRAHEIRHTVFIEEQEIAPQEEWDGQDEDALHFLIIKEGKDVGTGRLAFSGSTAKLQRIAVIESARGQSIGLALIEAMVKQASRQPQIKQAHLGAQCYAIPFYEKLGFKAYGD